MRLTAEQTRTFDELGYVFFADCFAEEGVAVLRSQAEAILRSNRPEVWRSLPAQDRVSHALRGLQPHHQFTRPEWIAHRDFAPIVPVGDDALIAYARAHRVAAE